ncbi:hypothetical protein ASC80_03825 [Afipia sp. Root123D2]|uniref:hypothetical protein n=1 Tax=Afipia sp. Root123D2 TaxID=1736436 RepID=UPI0006F4848E|nr:hypothetical protein [Afipia sp. Root123D2]KQW22520.1 hypothetical protein ASC80_03825 [Afipia sp. Root123D2]
MTLFSLSPLARRARHSHLLPLVASTVIGGCAIVAIAYLLWPTWNAGRGNEPDTLPITIANTLFNVPTKAVRMRLQKRTGPQERVDLAFVFPSLEPPAAPKHVTAETVETELPSIDRIFVSIAAHHDALSPDERLRTIYPRYYDSAKARSEDGLTWQSFEEGSPYSNEDLVTAASPNFVARCSRDADTPGMCMSERRIEEADLVFRFPRDWLSRWRDVAGAMETLVARMRGPRG